MVDYKGPPPIDSKWIFGPDSMCVTNPAPDAAQAVNPFVLTGQGTFINDALNQPESTLQEAHRLTHGPRRADYGHPLDDYTRTAGMVNALFAHKLKEPLLAEDVTMIMQCVKLSRHINAPKRDNMVDAAGYGWATWEIKEERDRRNAK